MTGRRLVVLLDGTSNEVAGNATNVLKLYRMLDKNGEQLAFYHPGVGTLGVGNDWARLSQKFWSVIGLATGWGLDANILAAYDFLARNHRDGDRIHLFGFSRGAYTARALAGFIFMLGLLRPEQLNLASYALKAYKRVSTNGDFKGADHFRRVIDGRSVLIEFVGVWDTVASVLVPWVRGPLPTMQFLPFTKRNPAVKIFREACALDERRAMFRHYRWKPDQRVKLTQFGEDLGPQHARTVWFAGEHSDIGGDHPEAESQPAKHPLLWMIAQARAADLTLDDTLIRRLGAGERLAGGQHQYVTPRCNFAAAFITKGAWWLLEWVPKKMKWRRWPSRSDQWGYYVPWAEPRKIEGSAIIHRSVQARSRRHQICAVQSA